jgi:hypothetical protein
VDPLKIVENYKVKGGPAPTEVERALTIREQRIALSKSNVSKIKQKIDEAEGKLQSTVKSYLLSNSLGSGRFKNLSL